MEILQEHRARKGCYVVIGHRQDDHSDYLVGHYISLSRARKAARNKARMAGAHRGSMSDVFSVYDSRGECRYRVSHEELAKYLQHPGASLEMPKALPNPRPTYDKLFLCVFLGLFVLLLLWQGKKYYEGMELSGQSKLDYAEMWKQFAKNRPGGNCSYMSWDRYQWLKRTYEGVLHSPTLPRAKTEYLRDKLRFYEETAYEAPDVVRLLADFSRKELANAEASEMVGPDALYEKNRRLYLAVVKQLLPLQEELGSYVIDWNAPAMPVITHWDYDRLKHALGLCEKIIEIGRMRIPSVGFLLDNGNGKEVPLDGFEATAFDRMIAAARERQDISQTNTLFQSLVIYQVANWNVYYDTVEDSIARYRRFLDEQGLDKPTQFTALEARLSKLNPHEYSQKYRDYYGLTLRLLRMSPVDQTSAPGRSEP